MDTGFNYLIDGGIIFVYLATLTAIGVYFSKRQKSLKDFFLTRRGMAWLPVGLSLMAALNSGIDYIMQPSAVMRFGFLIIIGTLSWLVLYPYVARITLPFYHRMNFYSAYEYLERRFDVRVRCMTAFIFIIWRLGWMGTALYVPCLAINAATGGALPIVPMVIVLGAVVTVYTMLGGINAVVWTDVTQFCIMFSGLGATVAVILANVPGGVVEVLGTASSAGKLLLTSTAPATPGVGLLGNVRDFFMTDVTIIGLIIAAVVGRLTLYTGDQVMIQRFQITRSVRDAKQSFIINIVGDTVWMVVLGFVGLSLLTYLGHHPLPGNIQHDRIFPQFISETFPVGVTGLVIAAILAASLSSVDSAINSCTSVVIVDFYNRLILKKIKPEENLTEAQQRTQVRVSRIATVILGIAAVALAANVGRLGDLIEIANKVIQSFTGPILGIFLLGMFTRRAQSAGVLVGGMLGAVVAAYVAFFSKVSFLWPSTFGFLSTVLVAYALSLLQGAVPLSQQKWTFREVMARPEAPSEPEVAAENQEGQ